MKKKILNEVNKLTEFIQKVNDIVSPISFRDELRAVMDRNTRKHLCEKHPKCWLPVNISNSSVPFLPICNRNGATDKRMIAFSMKLANRLLGREDVDRGMLEITIKKLDRLNSVYSKDTPKPADMAARKANVTKAMMVLKRELDKIKTSNDEPIPPKAPVAVP